MPNRSSKVRPPSEYTASTGTWPEGPFDQDAPPAALYAAEIARRLRIAIDESGRSVTAIADALSVARSTLYDALNGAVYVDTVTLAAAEAYLGVRLWPDHIPTG